MKVDYVCGYTDCGRRFETERGLHHHQSAMHKKGHVDGPTKTESEHAHFIAGYFTHSLEQYAVGYSLPVASLTQRVSAILHDAPDR